MFTLKIAWFSMDRHGIQQDETTLFIPADQVRVHSAITVIDGDDTDLRHWPEGSYLEYRSVLETADGVVREDGRLIAVVKDGDETYYTASRAWILGANGQTIERIAP